MRIERIAEAAMALTLLVITTKAVLQQNRIRKQEETIAALLALPKDTIFWETPTPGPAKDSIQICWKDRWLPAVHDTTTTTDTLTLHDTVRVFIPITQKHYAEDEYDAWVSGYEPKLDSLHIHMPNILPPTIIKQRRNGWAITIGPQVGITATREPYVGLGITAGFSFGISK